MLALHWMAAKLFGGYEGIAAILIPNPQLQYDDKCVSVNPTRNNKDPLTVI